METDKCDFCGKPAKYYLSERETYSLYSLQDKEWVNDNEWEDNNEITYYCQECAEKEEII